MSPGPRPLEINRHYHWSRDEAGFGEGNICHSGNNITFRNMYGTFNKVQVKAEKMSQNPYMGIAANILLAGRIILNYTLSIKNNINMTNL